MEDTFFSVINAINICASAILVFVIIHQSKKIYTKKKTDNADISDNIVLIVVSILFIITTIRSIT